MKLDILLPEFKSLSLPEGAEVGDLLVIVNDVVQLNAKAKAGLEKLAKGQLGDLLPVLVARLAKPADVAGLLRQKKLNAIVGEVVASE